MLGSGGKTRRLREGSLGEKKDSEKSADEDIDQGPPFRENRMPRRQVDPEGAGAGVDSITVFEVGGRLACERSMKVGGLW
jgi:hypothetical protein